MKLIRRIKGGGPNPFKRSLAILAMASASLLKDLVEILTLGTHTSDIYEHLVWRASWIEDYWWQIDRTGRSR